jgi:hypothetical protein
VSSECEKCRSRINIRINTAEFSSVVCYLLYLKKILSRPSANTFYLFVELSGHVLQVPRYSTLH